MTGSVEIDVSQTGRESRDERKKDEKGIKSFVAAHIQTPHKEWNIGTETY